MSDDYMGIVPLYYGTNTDPVSGDKRNLGDQVAPKDISLKNMPETTAALDRPVSRDMKRLLLMLGIPGSDQKELTWGELRERITTIYAQIYEKYNALFYMRGFGAEEFSDRNDIGNLCKKLFELGLLDKHSLKDVPLSIDTLVALSQDERLYDRWMMKLNGDANSSIYAKDVRWGQIQQLQQDIQKGAGSLQERNAKIMYRNRLIMELMCPSLCPARLPDPNHISVSDMVSLLGMFIQNGEFLDTVVLPPELRSHMVSVQEVQRLFLAVRYAEDNSATATERCVVSLGRSPQLSAMLRSLSLSSSSSVTISEFTEQLKKYNGSVQEKAEFVRLFLTEVLGFSVDPQISMLRQPKDIVYQMLKSKGGIQVSASELTLFAAAILSDAGIDVSFYQVGGAGSKYVVGIVKDADTEAVMDMYLGYTAVLDKNSAISMEGHYFVTSRSDTTLSISLQLKDHSQPLVLEKILKPSSGALYLSGSLNLYVSKVIKLKKQDNSGQMIPDVLPYPPPIPLNKYTKKVPDDILIGRGSLKGECPMMMYRKGWGDPSFFDQSLLYETQGDLQYGGLTVKTVDEKTGTATLKDTMNSQENNAVDKGKIARMVSYKGDPGDFNKRVSISIKYLYEHDRKYMPVQAAFDMLMTYIIEDYVLSDAFIMSSYRLDVNDKEAIEEKRNWIAQQRSVLRNAMYLAADPAEFFASIELVLGVPKNIIRKTMDSVSRSVDLEADIPLLAAYYNENIQRQLGARMSLGEFMRVCLLAQAAQVPRFITNDAVYLVERINSGFILRKNGRDEQIIIEVRDGEELDTVHQFSPEDRKIFRKLLGRYPARPALADQGLYGIDHALCLELMPGAAWAQLDRIVNGGPYMLAPDLKIDKASGLPAEISYAENDETVVLSVEMTSGMSDKLKAHSLDKKLIYNKEDHTLIITKEFSPANMMELAAYPEMAPVVKILQEHFNSTKISLTVGYRQDEGSKLTIIAGANGDPDGLVNPIFGFGMEFSQDDMRVKALAGLGNESQYYSKKYRITAADVMKRSLSLSGSIRMNTLRIARADGSPVQFKVKRDDGGGVIVELEPGNTFLQGEVVTMSYVEEKQNSPYRDINMTKKGASVSYSDDSTEIHVAGVKKGDEDATDDTDTGAKLPRTYNEYDIFAKKKFRVNDHWSIEGEVSAKQLNTSDPDNPKYTKSIAKATILAKFENTPYLGEGWTISKLISVFFDENNGSLTPKYNIEEIFREQRASGALSSDLELIVRQILEAFSLEEEVVKERQVSLGAVYTQKDTQEVIDLRYKPLSKRVEEANAVSARLEPIILGEIRKELIRNGMTDEITILNYQQEIWGIIKNFDAKNTSRTASEIIALLAIARKSGNDKVIAAVFAVIFQARVEVFGDKNSCMAMLEKFTQVLSGTYFGSPSEYVDAQEELLLRCTEHGIVSEEEFSKEELDVLRRCASDLVGDSGLGFWYFKPDFDEEIDTIELQLNNPMKKGDKDFDKNAYERNETENKNKEQELRAKLKRTRKSWQGMLGESDLKDIRTKLQSVITRIRNRDTSVDLHSVFFGEKIRPSFSKEEVHANVPADKVLLFFMWDDSLGAYTLKEKPKGDTSGFTKELKQCDPGTVNYVRKCLNRSHDDNYSAQRKLNRDIFIKLIQNGFGGDVNAAVREMDNPVHFGTEFNAGTLSGAVALRVYIETVKQDKGFKDRYGALVITIPADKERQVFSVRADVVDTEVVDKSKTDAASISFDYAPAPYIDIQLTDTIRNTTSIFSTLGNDVAEESSKQNDMTLRIDYDLSHSVYGYGWVPKMSVLWRNQVFSGRTVSRARVEQVFGPDNKAWYVFFQDPLASTLCFRPEFERLFNEHGLGMNSILLKKLDTLIAMYTRSSNGTAAVSRADVVALFGDDGSWKQFFLDPAADQLYFTSNFSSDMSAFRTAMSSDVQEKIYALWQEGRIEYSSHNEYMGQLNALKYNIYGKLDQGDFGSEISSYVVGGRVTPLAGTDGMDLGIKGLRLDKDLYFEGEYGDELTDDYAQRTFRSAAARYGVIFEGVGEDTYRDLTSAEFSQKISGETDSVSGVNPYGSARIDFENTLHLFKKPWQKLFGSDFFSSGDNNYLFSMKYSQRVNVYDSGNLSKDGRNFDEAWGLSRNALANLFSNSIDTGWWKDCYDPTDTQYRQAYLKKNYSLDLNLSKELTPWVSYTTETQKRLSSGVVAEGERESLDVGIKGSHMFKVSESDHLKSITARYNFYNMRVDADNFNSSNKAERYNDMVYNAALDFDVDLGWMKKVELSGLYSMRNEEFTLDPRKKAIGSSYEVAMSINFRPDNSIFNFDVNNYIGRGVFGYSQDFTKPLVSTFQADYSSEAAFRWSPQFALHADVSDSLRLDLTAHADTFWQNGENKDWAVGIFLGFRYRF